MDKITILGTRIDNTTFEEILRLIDGLVLGKKFNYIVTPNPEIALYAGKHLEYQQIINSAIVAIPDGLGLILAARFKGQKFQQRITGADLTEKILSAKNSSYKIFLLGGQPGIGEQVKVKFPQANIVGLDDGGKINSEGLGEKDQKVIAKINQSQANILLVAFGHPKQEYWLAKNKDKLASVRVAICIGGALDYLSGTIKRAPSWLRQIGLEWLYRLFRQPKRFFRILNATIVFSWKILIN